MVGSFYFAFIWFKVQGSGFRVDVAASPPFLLGDARKWYFSHQSLVTPTIRGRIVQGNIEYANHQLTAESSIFALSCCGWQMEISSI